MSHIFNIQLPPMPKPDDFGITDETWEHAKEGGYSDTKAAKAKIKAYEDALAAWRSAAEAIGRQK